MKSRFISDPNDPLSDLNTGAEDTNFFPATFFPAAGHSGGSPSFGTPPLISPPPFTPTLPAESAEAQAAVSGSGSGGTGSVVAETSSSGFTINLIFDAAAMAAPASFRTGIEQAASILSATITNKITVNIDIDYSGTGGGAAAGPDNGQFVSYSTVRADLANNAAPGDTTFNALPTGSTIQGQSQVAVWNAQLKLFGLLPANSTTTDDGSATLATDINSNLLVGVALHELTHAMGRVPYGSQPDIFDFYRFTSPGTYLFSDSIPSSAAYFSLNGGNTKLADFGLNSDPSDFLNPPNSNLTPNDAFNEFYSGSTLQSLTTVDKEMLDALGFNTIFTPQGIVVSSTPSSEAIQGGAAVALLSGTPSITDPASTTLSSATIKIANAGGSAVNGDELFVNGVQNGSVGNGVTASWNASSGTLTLTGSASIAVYDTLLSEVSYQDTGTDTSSGSHPVRTVTWTVNDGTNSYNTTSQVTIDRVPVANNYAAVDAVGTTLSATAATGVLSNDSDLDGDRLTVTAVSDAAHGAGSVGSSFAGVYGHLTLNADGSYSYVANNSSAINSAPTGNHLQDAFTYTVSDGNGGTAAGTLTITLDRPPVVTAANVVLGVGQTSVAASSLFSAFDPDGVAINTYGFFDTGSGHFVLNGVVQANNQEIDVTAAQLSQLTYQSASGTDTLWVRANDGTVWGAWSNSFTVTALVDSGPVETVSNLTAAHGQSYAGSSLFTYSDPFGSAATQYDVWDTGSGGGHFVLNGVTLGANQDNIITAAQLAQLSYQSGSGADTLWVRANDGTVWGAWSNAFTVTAPVDSGPVETVSNLTAAHGQSYAGSSLFTYSDPFASAATQYDVWDTGSGGGHFVLNGVTLGANQDNIIMAAQLAQLSYQSGSGADTLWVRANDGTVWGTWSNSFTVTAPVDSGPVEMVSNLTAAHGQSYAGSSLFTYSDPFGSAATQYDVWDTGGGGGHFVLNGVTLGANQDNILTAAQLAQLSYQSGSGADTLWVRANDGTVWGAWSSSFTVTAPVDNGPVETPTQLSTQSAQGQIFAGSSLFTYSDPFGSAATQYDVWDTGSGGGHFVLNGATLGANQDNIITAAQLSQLTYQVGSGTDTLWVRANDGTVWGAWSSAFTISDPATIGAGKTLELPSAFSGALSFAAATGTLKIDNPSTFNGLIFNFSGNGTLSGSDQIDLKGINFNSVHDSYASGVLTVSDGTNSAALDFNGSYSLANFKFANDGSGGTIVYDPPVSGQPSPESGAASNTAGPATATSNLLVTAAHDSFVFGPDFGQVTIAEFNPASNTIQFSRTVFTNLDALMAATHDDGHGNAVIADAAHDTITIQHVTTAQLLAHQSDFHFV